VTLHRPPDRAGRVSGADAQRLVDDVVDEVGRRHARVRWLLTSSACEEGIAIAPEALREVLLVLIENAAEASPADGEITVRLECTAGRFTCKVGDRGGGFVDGVEAALFERGASTKAGGHGYGLYLARRLVEACGGSLQAARVAEGGSLFSLTLPFVEGA
jgi:signal transduction histidine kinase